MEYFLIEANYADGEEYWSIDTTIYPDDMSDTPTHVRAVREKEALESYYPETQWRVTKVTLAEVSREVVSNPKPQEV